MCRTHRLATLAFSVAALSACTTIDVNDYCRYSNADPIAAANPNSLGLLLGVSPKNARETPFVVLHSPSGAFPDRSVTLVATRQPIPLPSDLDESSCRGVDWVGYSLTVDAHAWKTFWAQEHPSRFEIGVASHRSVERTRLREYGVAIINSANGQYIVSCGCFWR